MIFVADSTAQHNSLAVILTEPYHQNCVKDEQCFSLARREVFDVDAVMAQIPPLEKTLQEKLWERGNTASIDSVWPGEMLRVLSKRVLATLRD